MALVVASLGDAPVDLVTGDLGLVLAAIDALETTDARKAALRRHVWRPARFRALLHRYGEGQAAATAARADLLAAEAAGRTPALVAAAGNPVGLRAPEDVAARVARLAAEAATPPLDPAAVAGIGAVLAVEGSAPEALGRLETLARRLPGLDGAVGRTATRLDALAANGIAPERLRFEASFGGPRSNTTTASSSAPCRAAATTCRRSPAAAATTRSPASSGGGGASRPSAA